VCTLIFANDWKSYRCVITSTIEAGGMTTRTLSTIACKKVGNENWIRATQLEPEKGRLISITKGQRRTILFPEDMTSYITTDPENSASGDFDKFAESLFEKGLSSHSSINKKLSDSLSILYGADSLVGSHIERRDGITDSLVFFKNVLPVNQVVLRRGYIGSDENSALMPLSMELINYSPSMRTLIQYTGYRINCEIPDDTFDERYLDE
jgi:hypothetical protein